MKSKLLKSFIVFLNFILIFSILSPSLVNASETQNVQYSKTEEELINDFLYNDEDFQDTLTYQESLEIYNRNILENSHSISEQTIKPFNLFSLLFSLVRSGTTYIIKVTKKGNVIKNVRNGKLEVDVSKHINAKNRFKDYGNIDKLVKYIVEDIRRVDELKKIKEGHNSIKTVYGPDNKLLEIRFYVKDGELYSFNAFPNHSSRDAGNVIWLAPQ
ncbi:hypothetical protein [Lysinibacillus telephonicus]|uniref:hypothetical protein n=1 Tax=Lysinibacillus telephonicus TaxID=1714840 RepID=UPI001FEC0F63|nr:hypothetical protein [Lysinibacillus telephonicus]